MANASLVVREPRLRVRARRRAERVPPPVAALRRRRGGSSARAAARRVRRRRSSSRRMAIWIARSRPRARGGVRHRSRPRSGQFGTLAAERQRLAVWSAQVRAVVERPALGWGPCERVERVRLLGDPGRDRDRRRGTGRTRTTCRSRSASSRGSPGSRRSRWLLVRILPRTARSPNRRAWATASAATLARLRALRTARRHAHAAHVPVRGGGGGGRGGFDAAGRRRGSGRSHGRPSGSSSSP